MMIGLSDGFTIIPEGETVLKVKEVVYKEDFGKLEVILVNSKGQKHTERFSLLKANGEPNDGALNAFSYFAKVLMNDFSLKEIDHEDLVGHYIRVVVEHEEVESKNRPGKYNTFTRLGDKEPADGFDDDEAAETEATEAVHKKKVDLKSLLG